MLKTLLVAYILLIATALSAQDSLRLKNNLTIKPFNASSTGLGMAVQYERYIDSKNNFSIVLPIGYSFSVTNDNSSNFNDQFGIEVNPTLRFYFKEPRSFNWYLGTSVFYGYGYSSAITSQNFSTYQTAIGPLVHIGFKGTIQNKITYQLDFGNGYKIHNRGDM